VNTGNLRALKTFVLLLLTQSGCLALGLWLEVRFVEALAAAPSVEPVSATTMRVLAFGWIVALQGAAAYLVLSRFRTDASRRERDAANDSFQQQHDLLRTRDAVIFGLAKLAESRDPDTGNHLERIALYSTHLASALRSHPRYGARVSSSFIKLIGISSALHDIGKVGIPDSILLKPARLEGEELEQMRTHAQIGGRCIQDIERRLGKSNFLQMAREIALSHHERWDGGGYPAGLAGEAIPLSARIVAIVDVYDALLSKRAYKSALCHEECVAMIAEEAGSHFDPELVDVFVDIHREIQEIAERCTDRQDENVSAGVNMPADSLPVLEPGAIESAAPTVLL